MGLISTSIDRLPKWAKVLLGVILMLGGAYYISRYGLVSFLLHLIFGPYF